MVSDSLNPYNRSEEASSGDALGLNTNQVRTKYEPSTNQVKDLILSVSEDYRLNFRLWFKYGLLVGKLTKVQQAYIVLASIICAARKLNYLKQGGRIWIYLTAKDKKD